ncbi:NUDIX hydrolase [Paracoccus sp. T5]|uniref:NUDIX hydrolase n=1 Tax=Paracoccus sp. T5 TaxID=3402161 RepID=UPI003AEC445E
MTGDWSEARLRDALRTAAGPSSDYDLNPEVSPPEAPLRPAGVLAAFRAEDGRLLLTKRGSGLRHHPGQIALPGGKVEPGDADAVAAALREAREEVGLDPAQVRLLGCLPPHRTVTGFSVTPVLGVIDGAYIPVPEAGEVEEAFFLPFGHVADPSRYRIERRRWRGGWRSYHAAPFGPYYLWGATARILLGLARRLHP